MNGRCVIPVKQDDLFCNVVSLDKSTCTGCNFGYFLNSNNYCSKIFSVGCNQNCTQCISSQFILDNSQCYYQDAYATVIDLSTFRTLACYDGYQLNPTTGWCERAQTCLSGSSTSCTRCISGYQPRNNRCVQLPRNCLAIDPTWTTCQRCATNTATSSLVPIPGMCVFIVQQCIQYNQYAMCSRCASGFALSNRQCISLAANCQTMLPSDNSKCSVCVSGFHLDTFDQSCYININGCISYGRGSACLQCSQSYTLQNSICINNTCQPGYYLSINNTCQRMIDFCAVMNINTGRCTSCISRYIINRDICILAIPNCQDYNPNGSCLNCISNAFKTPNATCVILPNRCLKLDNVTFLCSQCLSPFILFRQDNTIICSRNISNCIRFDNSGNCIGCDISYVLRYGLCVFNIDNCKVNNNKTCIQCENGFEIANNGLCCRKITPNCKSFDCQFCIQCNSGYYLDFNKGCSLIPQGCKTYNPSLMRCTECQLGYSFNSQGICVVTPKIPNCIDPIPSTTCKNCDLGYEIANNGLCCRKITPNCKSFDCQFCIQCNSGYYLDFNKGCSLIPQGCKTYNPSLMRCTECQLGYSFNSQGICVVTPKIPNCIDPIPSTTCKNCDLGYEIANNGLCCRKITPNCKSFDCQFCIQCNSGYYLDFNKGCSLIPQGCKTYNPSLMRCTECQLGYSFNSQGICVVTPKIPNCIDPIPSTTCKNCDLGYEIANNGLCCRKITPNCKSFDCQFCIQCNSGYYLDFNKGCSLIPQGCKTYNPSLMRCTECQLGYSFNSQGICVVTPKIPNCIDPIPSTTCKNCDLGYEIANNGLCCRKITPNCKSFDCQFCIQCNSGYYLDFNKGCSLIPQGCKTYNPSLMRCTECQLGYSFNSQGICVVTPKIPNCIDPIPSTTCKNCDLGYEIANNGLCCRKITPNCKSFDCQFCIQCNSGYYLDFNKGCSLIPQGCKTYNPSLMRCTECQLGYSFNSQGICVVTPKIPNCIDPIPSTTCKNCDLGYEIANNGLCCRKITPNCKSFDCQFCIQCNSGYYLDFNKGCSLIPQGCKTYNPSLMRCTECQLGYSFNSQGICVVTPKIPNCIDPIPSTTCKNCDLGYEIANNGLCCRKITPNCKSFDCQFCIQCNSGYYLDFNKGCSLIPQGCKTYNPSLMRCTECQLGYSFNSQGICVVTPKIPNCIDPIPSTTCKNCDLGYEIANNGLCCRKITPNCKSFDCQFCIQCNSGYYLDFNKGCSLIPQGCKTYNPSLMRCTECQLGYSFNSQGICVVTPKIPNCIDPIPSTTCKNCDLGYEIANNGLCCRKITPNCKSFDCQFCIQCNSGYYLDFNKGCSLIPQGCKTYNPSLMRCTECQLGYSFNSQGICVVTPKIPNCIDPIPSTTCKNCDLGYEIANNGLCCRKITPNCKSFDCQFCIQCNSGYYLDFNKGCSLIPQGCKTYNPSLMRCTECQLGYSFNSQGICVVTPKIPNCIDPIPSTTCKNCDLGYEIANNGLCCRKITPNCKSFDCQFCIQCNSGYYLDFNKGCSLIPQGCKTYNPSLMRCTECQLGYSFNSQGICVVTPKIPNCIDPIPSTTCKNCDLGYEIANNGLCCRKITPNCKSFDCQFCIQCNSGYYLDFNKGCSLIPQGCKTYNPSLMRCTECQLGYSFNSQGICVVTPKIPNCIDPIPSTTCKNCDLGYEIANNGLCCRKITPNCKSFDCQFCIQCNSGYYLDFNKGCSLIPQGCKTYNPSLMRCTECQLGYSFNSQGICVVTPKIPNCIDPIPSTTCKNCDLGYEIANNGLCCRKITPNCKSFDCQFCIQCNSGYYLDFNKGCSLIPQGCKTYNPSLMRCTECQLGYSFNSQGICVVTPKIPNCIDPIPSTTCKNCDLGYEIANNGLCCRKITPNCKSFDCQFCIQCNSGYYLDFNKGCSLIPQGCKTYNPSLMRCTECQLGYSFNSQGICVVTPKIPNCIDPIPSTTCKNCDLGYEIANNGLCCRKITPNCKSFDCQFCIQCNSGYYLDFNKGCSLIPQGCKTYNPSLMRCTECQLGYSFNSQGICVVTPKIPNCIDPIPSTTCKNCDLGYEIANNGLCCRKITPNCKSFDCQFCIQCNSGYYLDFNKGCSLIPQGCKTYNPSLMRCTECQLGYSFNSQGICVVTPKIPNCIDPIPSTTCKNCDLGYEIANNGLCCRKITPNCKSFDCQFCIQCNSGYYLDFNKGCSLIPQGCKTYNPSLMRCTECQLGYSFNSQGICVVTPKIPNCIDPIPSTTCKNCDLGYEIANNGLCCRKITPNCKSFDCQFCIQCNSGYYLDFNKGCSLIPQGCKTYNPSLMRCTECQLGYSFNSQGICVVTPKIPNCIDPIPSTTCKNCDLGYEIANNGLCCRKITPNCKSFDCQFCIQCNSGYYLDFNKGCSLIPQGCKTYNPSLMRCTECQLGYSFNSQGICVVTPKIPNCIDPIPSTTCKNCDLGYEIANNGLCCRKITPNCKSFDCQFCIQCNSGYYLDFNKGCSLIPQGCKTYNPSLMRCTECQLGYSFNSQGICIISHCSKYNTLNLCIQCNLGYLLFNNFCFPQIPNCKVQYQYTCTICNTNYYLSNYTCIQNIPNCLLISNNKCKLCQYGYNLVNGYCYEDINDCLKYNNNGQCIECLTGYYLCANKKCVLLPKNCITVDINGICTSCKSGFMIFNGGCVNQINNCISYSLTTGLCQQCDTLYYLNSQFSCVLLPSNCVAANANGICTSCKSGFVIFNGGCVNQINNCISYSLTTGLCQQCDTLYYLNSQFSCVLLPSNCVAANANGICTSCKSGFVIFNGGCVNQINNCISYSLTTGLCQQCDTLYYLNSQFSCIPFPSNCLTVDSNGRCLTCVSRCYLLNYLCYPNPPFCQLYNLITLKCTQCISLYNLSPNGTCIINLPNCLYYGSNGCSKCVSKFYLSNNTCIPYPSLCVNVDLLGNCISCCFGSKLINSQCVPDISRSNNCLTFNSTNQTCLQCMTGYQYCLACLICLKIDGNCIVYNPLDASICLKCQSGFMLIGGDCINTPPGIAGYQSGSVSCFSGYQLNNNHCYRALSQLNQLTTVIGTTLIYSSYKQGTISLATPWQPLTNSVNQYVGFSFSSPALIQAISLSGQPKGWVTNYVIYFRNSADKPFICWNNCLVNKGNIDGTNSVMLRLDHPLIASEVRIYPTTWSTTIVCKLQMYGNLI